MSEFYGVLCENPECRKFISLGKQNELKFLEIQTFWPPLGPVPCLKCGSVSQYGTADITDEHGKLLQKQPEES